MSIKNRLQQLWQLKSIKITLIFLIFFVLFHLSIFLLVEQSCSYAYFVSIECNYNGIFKESMFILFIVINFPYLFFSVYFNLYTAFPVTFDPIEITWEIFKSGILSSIIVFFIAHLILLAIGKFGNNRK